jgi:hypothetical protein
MGRIVFIIYFLTSLSILAIVGNAEAQSSTTKVKEISKYRIGAAVGYSFLTTRNMDFQITRDYKEIRELQPSGIISVQRLVNKNQTEVGLVFRHGEMQTLLRTPGFASRCIFDELQLTVQWSLNHNANLARGRFTYNMVAGAGIINFKSKYISIVDDSNYQKTVSSVGYPRTDWDLFQLKRQNAFIGNIGFAVGARLNKYFSLYWESSFNLSSSTKMKGSLFSERGGIADGYLFSSLGLYLRIQPSAKVRCPKLR